MEERPKGRTVYYMGNGKGTWVEMGGSYALNYVLLEDKAP